jgi:hypothetical protein
MIFHRLAALAVMQAQNPGGNVAPFRGRSQFRGRRVPHLISPPLTVSHSLGVWLVMRMSC